MRKVICDYCGRNASYVDSAVVYGKSYGMIWYCAKCKAWVGVQNGTDKPLGRLADNDLRKQRKIAHAVFDRIWRYNRHMKRSDAYKWLSRQMGLPIEETHIGMMDLNQCRQVTEICRKYFQEGKNNVTEQASE